MNFLRKLFGKKPTESQTAVKPSLGQSRPNQAVTKERCAKCGVALFMGSTEPMNIFDPQVSILNAARYLDSINAQPGRVCEDCGAVVCKGCLPVPLPLAEGILSCPKCGSKNLARP